MEILLNGESKEIHEGATLTEVICEMDLNGKRYAVEVNLEIVPKSDHGEFILSNGDRVEIVLAVGGG